MQQYTQGFLFPLDVGLASQKESPPCLSVKRKPSLTKEERKARKNAQRKIRYYANREKMLAQKKRDYEKHKVERLIKCKIYYIEHKDHHRARCRQYQQENATSIADQKRLYAIAHKNEIRLWQREYKRNNWTVILAKQNAARKRMLKEDLRFAITTRLRGRMGQALRKAIAKKNTSTMKLVGCSTEDFMRHIEAQFAEGMTWDNRHLWHLDHIRPCASFDLNDPQQQKECFHYTNIQPLWAFDNKSKSSHWVGARHSLKTKPLPSQTQLA